jgi:hypothetical protein
MRFMLCLRCLCGMGLFSFVLSAAKNTMSSSVTKVMSITFSYSANVGYGNTM